MVFHDWYGIWRVAVAAIVAYVALVAFVRLSGKRTLAKLNAFDLVVTVALGSTLATIALSADVALTEGITVLGALVVLQLVAAWSASRSNRMNRVLKSQPALVLRDGTLLHDSLEQHRLTAAEVLQAIRHAGFGDAGLVAAVILEPDGTLSVISRDRLGAAGALAGTDWPSHNAER